MFEITLEKRLKKTINIQTKQWTRIQKLTDSLLVTFINHNGYFLPSKAQTHIPFLQILQILLPLASKSSLERRWRWRWRWRWNVVSSLSFFFLLLLCLCLWVWLWYHFNLILSLLSFSFHFIPYFNPSHFTKIQTFSLYLAFHYLCLFKFKTIFINI